MRTLLAMSLRIACLLAVLLSFGNDAQALQALPTTASQAGGQTPMRFEVISIHPHPFNGNDASSRQMQPGGRFVATATSVRTLIRVAFAAEDNRIIGAPGWIDSETYDINAITVDRADVTNAQQFQQLILSLLEDRFQLKVHRAEMEAPVYWLEVEKAGKIGPALKPSVPGSQPVDMSNNSNGVKTVMKVTNMSMKDIAAGLRRQVGRPVEDHTGLAGNFDFKIEWAPEETPDSSDPSLFTVLKEQLGLRLRPAKGMAENIVIDQIERPSAN